MNKVDFELGMVVYYDDEVSKKFDNETSHSLKYKNQILKGEVVAIGEQGICVDFGEGFQGHHGGLPVNFMEELDPTNFPNGIPEKSHRDRGNLWFFDFSAAENEFLTTDLKVIPKI